MLDFADFVAVNKSDKRGAADAARYVAKQMQRNWLDLICPSLTCLFIRASPLNSVMTD